MMRFEGNIMKSINAPTAFFMGIILLGAASCTMKQAIQLDGAGGGSVAVDIELADYLTNVIDQVQALLQPEKPLRDEEAPFFDTEAIRADFAKREGVELISLESPSRGSLKGEFRFDDVSRILQRAETESASSRMVRFEEHDGISELSVVINRETVEALLAENPSFNNPLVELFGPAATEGLSESDYLDMMGFALGEESRRGILDSSLDLTISVDGRIIGQKGGYLIDEKTVRYSIPLLPLLMLTEPLEYSLQYE